MSGKPTLRRFLCSTLLAGFSSGMAEDFAPLDSGNTWVYQGEFSGVLTIHRSEESWFLWLGSHRERLKVSVAKTSFSNDTFYVQTIWEDSLFRRMGRSGSPDLPDTVMVDTANIRWPSSGISLTAEKAFQAVFDQYYPSLFIAHRSSSLNPSGERLDIGRTRPYWGYSIQTSIGGGKSYAWLLDGVGLFWTYQVTPTLGSCDSYKQELLLVAMNGQPMTLPVPAPDSLRLDEAALAKAGANQCSDLRNSKRGRMGRPSATDFSGSLGFNSLGRFLSSPGLKTGSEKWFLPKPLGSPQHR